MSTKPVKESANKMQASGSGGDLTPQDAQDIVVNNTPSPANFKGPNQMLKELGIFGDTEVAGHKAGIVADIATRNMTIDENDIISGPGVSVAVCRDSVFNNAN